MVVVDLKRVTHLHYAGAALLKAIPGLRAAGASRYVRDLVHAGGAAGYVELLPATSRRPSAPRERRIPP